MNIFNRRLFRLRSGSRGGRFGFAGGRSAVAAARSGIARVGTRGGSGCATGAFGIGDVEARALKYYARSGYQSLQRIFRSTLGAIVRLLPISHEGLRNRVARFTSVFVDRHGCLL